MAKTPMEVKKVRLMATQDRYTDGPYLFLVTCICMVKTNSDTVSTRAARKKEELPC